MAKLTLNDITAGQGQSTTINNNNALIETALENTVSRDGTSPNPMTANFDMNGFNILNQGNPITIVGWVWEGAWVTATAYTVGDVVENGGTTYICIVAHTSGTFATDLSAVKWQLVATASLPSQTTHSGKYLTTNGTSASWEDAATKYLPLAGGTLTGALTGTDATFTNVTLTGGSITGITDLAIADGGTGASSASAAFTALKQEATSSVSGVVQLLRNHIDGFILAPDNTTTLPIGAGQCADSTNTVIFSVAALSKTTSAWAVGTAAGGLDTGEIANNTWYHFYAIRRSDTGVTDILYSTSATDPTMPANYDYKKHIGAAKTDGSAQWYKMIQHGNYSEWGSGFTPTSITTVSGTAALRLVDVPTGIIVNAKLTAVITKTTTGGAVIHWDPAHGSTEPSSIINEINCGNGNTGGQIRCNTNTSAQIYNKLSAGSVDTYKLVAHGWEYDRSEV